MLHLLNVGVGGVCDLMIQGNRCLFLLPSSKCLPKQGFFVFGFWPFWLCRQSRGWINPFWVLGWTIQFDSILQIDLLEFDYSV